MLEKQVLVNRNLKGGVKLVPSRFSNFFNYGVLSLRFHHDLFSITIWDVYVFILLSIFF